MKRLSMEITFLALCVSMITPATGAEPTSFAVPRLDGTGIDGDERSVDAARSKTETGHVLEVSLPWRNLATEPKAGRGIGFQLCVNVSDGAIVDGLE